MALDEARTTSDTAADHVSDHNALHTFYNDRVNAPWGFPERYRAENTWDVEDDFEGSSLGGSWTLLGSSDATVEYGWATVESSTSGSSNTSSNGGFGVYRTDVGSGDFELVAKYAYRYNASDVASDTRCGLFIAESAGLAIMAGIQTSVGTVVDIVNVTTYNRASEWSTYGGSVNSISNVNLRHYMTMGSPWYVKLVYDATANEVTSYHSYGGPWFRWKTYTGITAPTDMGFALYSNSGDLYSDDGMAVDWFVYRDL